MSMVVGEFYNSSAESRNTKRIHLDLVDIAMAVHRTVCLLLGLCHAAGLAAVGTRSAEDGATGKSLTEPMDADMIK
jgi:hypothetical protein